MNGVEIPTSVKIGFSSLVIAILINIFQFLPVDSELPRHLRAFRKTKSQDAIYLFSHYKNIYTQHDLYFSLRKYAVNSSLVLPDEPGFTGRSDFLSGVVGLGNITKIEIRNYKITSPKLKGRGKIQLRGEMWTSAAARKSGIRGTIWNMYLNKENPDKIYVFYDAAQKKFILVDEILLDSKQLVELNEG